MRIDVRTRGEVDVVDVWVDDAGNPNEAVLHDRLERLLGAGRSSFILNLTRGPAMDRAWIEELVRCRERVRKHDGAIKLVLTRQQCEVAAAGELHSLFGIFRDEEEALDSFVPWYATAGIP